MLSNKTQRSYCMTLSKSLFYISWFLTDAFSFFLCIDIWSFKKWITYLTKSKLKAREKNVILKDQELRTFAICHSYWHIVIRGTMGYHFFLFIFLSLLSLFLSLFFLSGGGRTLVPFYFLLYFFFSRFRALAPFYFLVYFIFA